MAADRRSLNRFVRRLRTMNTPSRFCLELWRGCRAVIGIDRIGIFVPSEDGHYLRGLIGTDLEGRAEDLSARSFIPLVAQGSAPARVFLSRRPLLVTDTSDTKQMLDPGERIYFRSYDIRMLGIVPVFHRRRVIAVLSMDNLLSRRPLTSGTMARARACAAAISEPLWRMLNSEREAALLRSLEHYELAGLGVIVFDRAGQLRHLNPIIRRSLGPAARRSAALRDILAPAADRLVRRQFRANGRPVQLINRVLATRTTPGGPRRLKIVFAFRTTLAHGALIVHDITDKLRFDEELGRQEKKLRSLNELLARRNTRLKDLVAARTDELRRAMLNSIIALSTALNAKDRYTHGHSGRIYSCAFMIADRLGLSAEEKRILKIGGDLHDIGKIGTPEGILNKPQSLTGSEYQVVQEHPVMGAEILRPLGLDKRILDIVRHHHERWDGKGYPDGLKGEAIPLLTRIITVADVYDALVSARPYRSALPPKQLSRLLAEDAGHRLDPRLVQVLLACLAKPRQRRRAARRSSR